MGAGTTLLVALGMKIAQEGYAALKDQLRKAATDAGLVASDQQLEAILGAQLMTLHAATAAMYTTMVRLKELNDSSEYAFRTAPNVEVVDEMPPPLPPPDDE